MIYEKLVDGPSHTTIKSLKVWGCNPTCASCNNHIMKRVGCDPHVETCKAATLKRCPFGHVWTNIEECHELIEEDGESSNTPYNVCTEEEMRHKQDRDNE